ncbi:MAG TPA: 23S rRNA (adenine(2503)-C(2))-methyltransferase RlmN [Campylobacterales bacterium]|nr:23S rRNA (adenine(2503)-C(2))-methyltransferase RlmN [Campylobacterales bacterium]
MSKANIYDLEPSELAGLLQGPSFRATQVLNWVYKKNVSDFKEMNNLPKDYREVLDEKFVVGSLSLLRKEVSSDGSEKYLFGLADGKTMETVLLKMKEDEYDDEGKKTREARYTVCISSQVGCKVGCAFCLTAKGGFERNLTAGEIVEQVAFIKKDKEFGEEKSINIVFMGMGEPLDNMDNVVKAIKIITHKDALCIAPRRITISTSGLATKIEKLANLDLGVNLAISLHAVDDELREKLMPINKAYNIKSVIDAVRGFKADKRKKVLFEYLLLGGVNDDIASAKKLAKLLNGLDAKVNLILFNSYENSEFKRPTTEAAEAFRGYMASKRFICTIRESKGIDISAACGQLKQRDKDGR